MKRYILLPFLALLAGNVFGQDHASYSSYGGQSQLSAPLSVTLTDGFYAPSGSVLRVFTTGASFRDCAPLASSATRTMNYVLTRTFKVAGVTALNLNSARSTCEEGREVAYFDGLGRPLQTVHVQSSPLGRDIVQPFAYDALGREAVKYLPYTDAGGSGNFRTGAIVAQGTFHASPPPGSGVGINGHPYAVTVFEPSPLNRVQEQGFPGAAWQPGGGHSSRPGYGTNAADEVALWKVVPGGAQTTGNYQSGRLHRTVSRDENWTAGTKKGTVEEFRDLQDRVVLKRVWEDELLARDTRYLYDDLGNLRYVVPPGVTGSSFLDTDGTFLELVYGYRYDGRRRVTEKKVPGKGWEHMVYNRLDQVVLSQDANRRSANQWLFSKYDALGRTVMTGIYADGNGREAIQAALDAAANPVLWEARDNGNASGTGTGYSNASFPTLSVQVYHGISYYDDYDFYSNTFGGPSGTQASAERLKGLATGSRKNVLGSFSATLLSVSYYDLKGREVQTKAQNHLEGKDVVDNGYSFAGELLSSVRTHTAHGATTVIADGFEYDHAGRMLAQRQDINGQGEIVLSRMHYNETGQLVKKELHGTGGGTAFANATDLAYNERGWLKASTNPRFSMALRYQDGPVGQWNGNISGQAWGMGASLPNSFDYRYDGLNRLTSGTSTGIAMSEVLTYDAMGNITSLSRDGVSGTYGYTGNRLSGITGDLATGSYGYDANGNATTDGRTGVTLQYNHLNLPVSAVGGGANLAYTYDASGRKLRKVATGNTTVTTDYVAGIQYNGNAIDFIQTAEGRAVRSGSTYSYQYNLSDHLGNVRYSFDINAGVVGDLQRDDYYPFGKRKEGAYVGNNKYLYNGKELQEELGQYDYGARFYDPVVGRWNVVDPLAEKYLSYTPYTYVANNPIALIDPDGMSIEEIYGGVRFTEEDAISAFNVFLGKKKNLYMAIIGHDTDRNKINQFQTKFGNGQWQVFGARDFKEASLAMSIFEDKMIDNFALETHGGNDTRNSYIRVDENGSSSPDSYIYNNEVESYNRGTNIAEVSQLKAMTDKIKDGGNFILAACYVGQGLVGKDFGTNLNILTGNRLNTYLPKHFVHTGRISNGSGKTVVLDGSLRIDYGLGWLRTLPTGTQLHVNKVLLSRTVYPPVRILK